MLKADTEEAQKTENVEFFSQVLILTPCKGFNCIQFSLFIVCSYFSPIAAAATKLCSGSPDKLTNSPNTVNTKNTLNVPLKKTLKFALC